MNGRRKWTIKEWELAELTPAKVRDMIVECFFAAQKETFARAKERLGKPARDQEIRASVETAVQMAFLEVGGNFDAPTKADLVGAIAALARKAASYGTPDDIVEHHYCQIRKAIEHLPD